jgi:hypothetical protein
VLFHFCATPLVRPPSEPSSAVKQQADIQSCISSKANPLHIRNTTTATWGYGGSISSFEASTIGGGTCATLPASTITISSCSPVGGVDTCSPSVITAPASTLTSTITQCLETQSACTPTTISIAGPPTTGNTCPSCTPAGPIETVTSYQTTTIGNTCSPLTYTPVTIYSTTTAISTISGGVSTETVYSTVPGPATTDFTTVASSCAPVQPAQTITNIITSTETLTIPTGTSTIISTVTSTLQGGETTITQTIPAGTSTVVSTVVSTETVSGSETTVSYSLPPMHISVLPGSR